MDLRLTANAARPVDQCVTVTPLTKRGEHVVAAFGFNSPCSWDDSIKIEAVAMLTGFQVLRD